MSTFDTPWFSKQSASFFNTLNKSKVPHLVLAAETDDFDESTIQQWTDEGFDVRYVPLAHGGQDFTDRVHAVGDSFGLSEQYAIIAFGAAASLALEAHTTPSSPRLVAVIAYYPSALPGVHTKFPASLRVLVHLAGAEISVMRRAEVLGVQSGRRRLVRKRIDRGEGPGERVRLPGNFCAYTYGGAEPGFAEADLEEHDGVAAGLAFARSVEVLAAAFRREVDVEGARDRFARLVGMPSGGGSGGGSTDLDKAMGMMWPDAHVLFAPTLAGAVGDEDAREFYADFFTWPEDAEVQLLSRTVGGSRVVDELFVSLTHSDDIPWLLPGVSPTGKKIEIAMVSVFHMRGSRLESEHIYWDQASVLVQAGLLDAKLLPNATKGQSAKRLPVIGAESARAIKRGSTRQVNHLIPDW